MKISELNILPMRSELSYYLDRLQDEHFQDSAWRGDSSEASLPQFSDIIHFLFDDTRLSRDPSSCIGVFLLNEGEADAIRVVTTTIDLMLDRHGWKTRDAEYLDLPEWPAIVEAARHANYLISPGTPPL